MKLILKKSNKKCDNDLENNYLWIILVDWWENVKEKFKFRKK